MKNKTIKLRSAIIPSLFSLVAVSLPSTVAHASDYYFYGTAADPSYYNWTNTGGAGTTWGDGTSTVSGSPTAGDSVILSSAYMGGTGKRLVSVNTSPTITNLDTTGLSNEFTLMGLNSTLTITGVLTKNTTSSLHIRNNGANTLTANINDVEVSAGVLNFGTSAGNRIKSVTINTLNMTGGTMNVTGTNQSVNTIHNVTMSGNSVFAIFGATGAAVTEVATVEVDTLNSSSANSLISAQNTTSATTGKGTGVLRLNSTVSTTSTYAGKLRDYAGSGTGGVLRLEKTGAGTQIISGDLNDYTGGSSVTQGALLIANTAGSATGTGAVDVSETGIFGGTGRSTGALTVYDGAVVTPGMADGETGILTVGSVDFKLGSNLVIDLNGDTIGTGYDQLSVLGSVTLAGTLTLRLDHALTGTDPYIILANDGMDDIFGTFSGWAEGASKTFAGQEFGITYKGGDGNDIAVYAVPEPSSWVLLGAGALLLASGSRLRSRFFRSA